MKIRMNKNKDKAMEENRDLSEEQQAAEEQEKQVAAEESEVPEDAELQEEPSELEELRNKYLRLVAEFDNYRKRMARERIELMQTSEKDVMVALLDVLDDTDRAEEQMEKTDNIAEVKEGTKLIFNKLRKTLQARGLKAMHCVNEAFDAELQEAVAEIPAPTEELIGKVIDDVQKGYYLNDKLIRHAKVVVGK